jgi:hypothetical protein
VNGRSATSPGSDVAADEQVDRVAAALATRNVEVIVVDTADEARERVLALLPKGVEVHSGKSKTLEDIGLAGILLDSDVYDSIRPRAMKMDRATQGREIRKLIASPDFMLGSPQAITEDGDLVFASATGSQLGPIVSGAERVILVAGTQKIVPDLPAALARIREVVFPWEDARVRERMSVGTALHKLVILRGEWQPGRTTLVLVRELVGV